MCSETPLCPLQFSPVSQLYLLHPRQVFSHKLWVECSKQELIQLQNTSLVKAAGKEWFCTSWEETEGNKIQASSPADCKRWRRYGESEASRKEEVLIGAPTPGTKAMSCKSDQLRTSLRRQSYIEPVIFQSLLDGGKDIVLIFLPILLILLQLLLFRNQTALLFLHAGGLVMKELKVRLDQSFQLPINSETPRKMYGMPFKEEVNQSITLLIYQPVFLSREIQKGSINNMCKHIYADTLYIASNVRPKWWNKCSWFLFIPFQVSVDVRKHQIFPTQLCRHAALLISSEVVFSRRWTFSQCNSWEGKVLWAVA